MIYISMIYIKQKFIIWTIFGTKEGLQYKVCWYVPHIFCHVHTVSFNDALNYLYNTKSCIFRFALQKSSTVVSLNFKDKTHNLQQKLNCLPSINFTYCSNNEQYHCK